ncbi:uncharacterized protein LOC6538070 [Drosophila yakuba]|uniref:Phospholipase A2 n=1 Tax=Drosophila yakuba TaxID=7245 RepID=B4PQ48_DROYA|nr:uncharacterized protein LOC6538070 [Drosophila yakuba]EDW98317.1 uncharacterized protein Dyak_GE10464 [Drosophila yakuba]
MLWLMGLVVVAAMRLNGECQVRCLSAVANVTVIEDIRSAFRGVTNDTELLNHIIPEMYGASMRTANPLFVFKMPSKSIGGGSDFQLLTMQRSDFAEPIFPNISLSTTVTAIDSPSTSAPETSVKTSLMVSPHQEWQQMGLEGWTGELRPPVPSLEQDHRDTNPPISWQNSYPHDEIRLEFQNHHFDGRVTDIRVITSTTGKPAEMGDLMNDQNVYIARVNDPFGYSMKWSFTNDSSRQKELLPEGERGKRDVARLYSMIKCSTGCDPLIYKGYGCYCGFGGHGVPADGIDRCCRVHDKCYGQSNCISYLEYFVPYVWKCYRGKPLCAVDHGEFGGPDSCAARLCQCDLRLSRCLKKYYCPHRRSICHSSRSRRLQNLIFFD